MKEHFLHVGYEYAVIDAGWYENEFPNGTQYFYSDGYSRLIPSPLLYPSTKFSRGFKDLADWVHDQGLKFGIHVMRGINVDVVERNEPIKGTNYRARDIAVKSDSCPWWPEWWGVDMKHPAAAAYYDSLLELYADWGVDFIKVDCMFSANLHRADLEQVSKSLTKTGRDIFYSLSPGDQKLSAEPSEAKELHSFANSYRITGDFWPCWDPETRTPPCHNGSSSVTDDFKWFPNFVELIGLDGLNGLSWPDADMLPFGNVSINGKSVPTAFTMEEQHTVFTLWNIFRSPLIMGGDLRRYNKATIRMLQNPEVLQVSQESTDNKPLWDGKPKDGLVYGWTAVSTNAPSTIFVALFNLDDREIFFQQPLTEYGFTPSDIVCVRDLWERKAIGAYADSILVRIAKHGPRLLQMGLCN
eukprot:TRINITY_DN15949_c0_g1_i1.p1 TRINITY_DN15949_c0_g1~~TRINITY_DN15949_c0_g1_i1.p1  ORF type:complete len:473 (+),score=57.36 TRINITY_DN15949_c0_g1_i1:182-1420(+)